MKTIFFSIVSILLLSYCFQDKIVVKETFNTKKQAKDRFRIVTPKSDKENTYKGFNSPNAINKIATIENDYFNDYSKTESKYYGTQWYTLVSNQFEGLDSVSTFDKYVLRIKDKGQRPDSMHCTIYAIKALEAGFGNDFEQIEKKHKQIWKNREYAGWSIAYILTKHYNWKAYLFISNTSTEYNACFRNFKNDSTYHVWKQPNIKIEKIFDVDKDTTTIDSLLNKNEFGWGFSEQGWHTWFTRYKQLKECNWAGVPAKRYNNGGKPLFITTKFTEFKYYNSHIVVFPPKLINK